jgi:small conductance mechanosensitive channel
MSKYLRISTKFQLNRDADLAKATGLLKERLAQIPHVLPEPAPTVEIQEFVGADPVLLVRPFVHNDHYWQVYYDTNRMIRESFAKGELPLPG